MADIVTTFSRSLRLVKASISVLNSDAELLVLPLLSGLTTAVVIGGFVWQAMGHGTLTAMEYGGTNFGAIQSYYLWLFALYIVQYFVIIFFNTALVGAAITRLEGGDPTLRSALGMAVRRIGPIFGYAVISATVGILLRFISERGGIIGRIFGAGIGLAWTVATFLVVPVLAAENIGPVEAIEKSSALLKKTWGENLVGNGGISLVMGLIALPLAPLIGYGMHLIDHGSDWTLPLMIFVVAGIPLVAIVLIGATVSAIYSASVYYYATVGEPPVDFDGDLISSAFSRKGS